MAKKTTKKDADKYTCPVCKGQLGVRVYITRDTVFSIDSKNGTTTDSDGVDTNDEYYIFCKENEDHKIPEELTETIHEINKDDLYMF